MINQINYSNRKGIYRDLYREIDADNNKKKKMDAAYQTPRAKKGIYKDLYRQLEEDKSVSFKANEAKQTEACEDKENIWHTYPLKGIAYSNDIGEALRPIIGSFLAKLSWIPAIFYVLGAILSKALDPSSSNKSKELTKEILFQSLASLALPILLVKSVGKATHKVLDKVPECTKDKIKNSIRQIDWLHKFGERFKKEEMNQYRVLAESGAGLFALAFAVKPIDNFVDNSLNQIYNRG